MPDGTIMMPMQQDAAAQQMLIEQVRRLTDSVDRFNTTMSDMREQFARMESDNRHMIERRDQNEARLTRVEDRVDVLEGWQSEQRGERSFLAAALQSKAFGVFVAALVAGYVAIKEGLLK